MNSGALMLDLAGLEITTEEKEILNHPFVGGIILFTRNYESPPQLKSLMKQIRAATKKRLVVAVDQEGGRVQRFRAGFTLLPALNKIGELYETDPERTKTFAHECGWLMAAELLVYDIDISFAPILDLNKNISEVIGSRSFHRDPAIVAVLAEAYINGMQQAGMAATGKHFPGHGSVAADSHTHIPVDKRSFDEIYQDDLKPFISLAKDKLTGIMPAHIIYENIDPLPAGFSHYWLQEILRKKLNFTGVIFSDDLSMAGASAVGDVVNRAHLALESGCNMILVCNDREAAIKVIDNIPQYPTVGLRDDVKEKLFAKPQFDLNRLTNMPLYQKIKSNLSTVE